MKKLIFFFAVFTLLMVFTPTVHAQEYRSAVGARLGYPLSISYKHFINDSHAFEAYAGARWFSGYSWMNVSAAYLVHKPLELEGFEGLQWYFGGGASVYFWNFGAFLGENYSTTTVGVQGYIGLDIALPNVPLNVTADWAPTLFVNGYGSGFGGGYGSVGVRYILAR